MDALWHCPLCDEGAAWNDHGHEAQMWLRERPEDMQEPYYLYTEAEWGLDEYDHEENDR